MKKIISVIALSISTMLLSACGGGGDSSSSTPSVAATSTVTNTPDALNGTYVLACVDETYTGGAAQSKQGTITVAPDNSGSTVVAHVQTYKGSTNCTEATMDLDLTVSGGLSGKSTTKNYKNATGKTVTANVVTVSYTGLKLSRGNLTNFSLPQANFSTDIAYVLDGKNLYFAKGHREADGLGDSLSRDVLVKQ